VWLRDCKLSARRKCYRKRCVAKRVSQPPVACFGVRQASVLCLRYWCLVAPDQRLVRTSQGNHADWRLGRGGGRCRWNLVRSRPLLIRLCSHLDRSGNGHSVSSASRSDTPLLHALRSRKPRHERILWKMWRKTRGGSMSVTRVSVQDFDRSRASICCVCPNAFRKRAFYLPARRYVGSVRRL